MRLMDIILSQPQKQLIERVKNKGITCNPNSRQELTENLVSTLLNKENAKNEWDKLVEVEKQLLLRISFSSSSLAYSNSELRIFLRKDDRKKFQDVIQSLLEKSWLFQDQTQFFYLPEELNMWIREFFVAEFEEYFLSFKQENIRNYTIIDDIYEMMDYFMNHLPRLTIHKTLYKNDLKKLLSRLSLQEELPTEKWRFGYGRHFDFYPDRFSLLYDFCFAQGWIKEEETVIVTEKWEKDQQMSVNELLEKLQRTYVNIFRRPIPQLPFIMNVMKYYLQQGLGIERNKLVNILCDFVDPYYYDSTDNIINKRIVNMLLQIHYLNLREVDSCHYITLHSRLLEKT